MQYPSESNGQLLMLIVEDNPVIRDLIRHAAKKFVNEKRGSQRGLAFEEVGDGAAALEFLKTRDVSLLVVDLYLPILGGIDLIRRVRETPALENTPIMAMSASYVDARSRSLGAGADYFLQKPLRLVDVMDGFESLLGDVLGGS